MSPSCPRDIGLGRGTVAPVTAAPSLRSRLSCDAAIAAVVTTPSASGKATADSGHSERWQHYCPSSSHYDSPHDDVTLIVTLPPTPCPARPRLLCPHHDAALGVPSTRGRATAGLLKAGSARAPLLLSGTVRGARADSALLLALAAVLAAVALACVFERAVRLLSALSAVILAVRRRRRDWLARALSLTYEWRGTSKCYD